MRFADARPSFRRVARRRQAVPRDADAGRRDRLPAAAAPKLLRVPSISASAQSGMPDGRNFPPQWQKTCSTAQGG